ncbi:MAG: hypothetical protein BWX72_00443 [Firmicutes bacterium ADurb.Bin080]|nr:MAG: hypothetical protein BWX72_00443 [Firmicutes bacterium ADurb.Bin080]
MKTRKDSNLVEGEEMAIETKRLSESADKYLMEMLEEGKFKEIINGMINIGGFSLKNQALIHKQMPNATELKGMRSWNFFGRFIKAEQKGIETLSPTFEKEGGKAAGLTGFKVHYLFDISQTEGAEYHSSKCLKGEVFKYIEGIKEGLEGVLSWKTKDGTVISHSLEDTMDRIFSIDGLSEDERAAALVLDVSDKLLRRKMGSPAFSGLNEEELPEIRTIMKASVFYIVLNRLSLNSVKLESPELSEMPSEDYERFKENLNVIRQVSQVVINNVETMVSLGRKEELKRVAKENYVRLKSAGKLPFETDESKGIEDDSPYAA